VEFLQLVVTQGIYLFDGYPLAFLQVNSQVEAQPVGRYPGLLSFFEYILQVVIFPGNCVSHVLVFVVLLIFDRRFGANVDSFQLNVVFDFITS